MLRADGTGRPGKGGGGQDPPSARTGDRDRGLAIRTEGLSRHFGRLRAVNGLSLSIPRGSVFGFLGPNGAGKTTTIRLLLGLVPPTCGRAEVLGLDPARRGGAVRERCGVLLEHSGLSERMSARDNLEFHGRIWRLPVEERRARIRELLLNVGLWERRGDRVASWSRGMRQKLAIARALLHRPELVFLDEPTAGLDPVAAAALREDLGRLARQEGVTVFLTTHNLTEADRLCDRVAVIREGRLVAEGRPSEIRRAASPPRLRVTGRGFSDNILELLRERPEVAGVHREDGRLLIYLREHVDVAALVGFLVRVGAEVEGVAPVTDTLEDVFLELVRGGRPGLDGWLADPSTRPPPERRAAS